jgi:hypothetical protein
MVGRVLVSSREIGSATVLVGQAGLWSAPWLAVPERGVEDHQELAHGRNGAWTLYAQEGLRPGGAAGHHALGRGKTIRIEAAQTQSASLPAPGRRLARCVRGRKPDRVRDHDVTKDTGLFGTGFSYRPGHWHRLRSRPTPPSVRSAPDHPRSVRPGLFRAPGQRWPWAGPAEADGGVRRRQGVPRSHGPPEKLVNAPKLTPR